MIQSPLYALSWTAFNTREDALFSTCPPSTRRILDTSGALLYTGPEDLHALLLIQRHRLETWDYFVMGSYLFRCLGLYLNYLKKGKLTQGGLSAEPDPDYMHETFNVTNLLNV